MQAPTTSTGPVAPRPDERRCPSCGAGNGPAAAFCWRCYRAFGAPAIAGQGPTAGSMPIRGRPGGIPRPYVPSPAPTPRVAASGGLRTMAGVVALTLAVVAGVVYTLNRHGAVATPDALAGQPRISNEQADIAVDTFRAQADAAGIEGDMVLYGLDAPTAALIWVKDATTPTTDAAFDEFATGFNGGIGGAGSLGPKSTETAGGVTYVCAPVTGPQTATLCMWQDEDVFWLMLDLSGAAFSAGTDLAVVAHDAVESA